MTSLEIIIVVALVAMSHACGTGKEPPQSSSVGARVRSKPLRRQLEEVFETALDRSAWNNTDAKQHYTAVIPTAAAFPVVGLRSDHRPECLAQRSSSNASTIQPRRGPEFIGTRHNRRCANGVGDRLVLFLGHNDGFARSLNMSTWDNMNYDPMAIGCFVHPVAYPDFGLGGAAHRGPYFQEECPVTACTSRRAYYRDGECVCDHPFPVTVMGSFTLCFAEASLDQPCQHHEQCLFTTKNSECDSTGHCACKRGYGHTSDGTCLFRPDLLAVRRKGPSLFQFVAVASLSYVATCMFYTLCQMNDWV